MHNKFVLSIISLVLCTVSMLQGIVVDSDSVNAEIKETQFSNQTIVDIMENNANLSTFLQSLSEAELLSTLEGSGPFTIFAPSNAAFEALPPEVLKNLMKKENKTKLAILLKNHIVSGKVLMTNSLKTGPTNTMGGKPLNIQVRGSQVKVNNANIVEPDLIGSNGVIQVVDSVINQ